MSILEDIKKRSKPCWSKFRTWSAAGKLNEDDVKWLISELEWTRQLIFHLQPAKHLTGTDVTEVIQNDLKNRIQITKDI